MVRAATRSLRIAVLARHARLGKVEVVAVRVRLAARAATAAPPSSGRPAHVGARRLTIVVTTTEARWGGRVGSASFRRRAAAGSRRRETRGRTRRSTGVRSAAHGQLGPAGRLPEFEDVHGDVVRRVAAEALAEVPRDAAVAGRREDLAVRPHEVLVAARGGELVDVANGG